MSLKDYCFDGHRTLKMKEAATDAGQEKARKKELIAQTADNIAKAAILQDKLYAERKEASRRKHRI